MVRNLGSAPQPDLGLDFGDMLVNDGYYRHYQPFNVDLSADSGGEFEKSGTGSNLTDAWNNLDLRASGSSPSYARVRFTLASTHSPTSPTYNRPIIARSYTNLDPASDSTCYVTVGNVRTGSRGFGVKMEGNTFYAVTYANGSEHKQAMPGHRAKWIATHHPQDSKTVISAFDWGDVTGGNVEHYEFTGSESPVGDYWGYDDVVLQAESPNGNTTELTWYGTEIYRQGYNAHDVPNPLDYSNQ